MTDFKNINYPIKIQFKTNLDDSWSSDMSSYVTGFTLDDKIEDDPYVFIENEIRMDIWDYDGGFLKKQSDWSSDIENIEVRGVTNIGTVFKGYLEIAQTPTKKDSLGIKENEKTVSMNFGSGIERYKRPIEYIYFGKATPTTPVHGILLEGLEYTLYNVSLARNLDTILNYLFTKLGCNVDYSALPIFNDSGKCFYKVNPNYFKNNDVNNLEFAKQVAKVFDCIINYNSVTNTIEFSKRDPNIENSINLDQSKISLNREVKPALYTGVKISYSRFKEISYEVFDSNGNIVVSNIDGKAPPTFTKFSKEGVFQFVIMKEWDDDKYWKTDSNGNTYVVEENVLSKYEDIDFVDSNKKITLIGDSQNTLNLDLRLIDFLYPSTPVNDSNSSGSWAPDRILTSPWPLLTLRQGEIIKIVREGAMKYLKPTVKFRIRKMEGLPNLTDVYSIDSEGYKRNGFITELTYKRNSGEDKKATTDIDITWKQITGFDIETPKGEEYQ